LLTSTSYGRGGTRARSSDTLWRRARIASSRSAASVSFDSLYDGAAASRNSSSDTSPIARHRLVVPASRPRSTYPARHLPHASCWDEALYRHVRFSPAAHVAFPSTDWQAV
jgi:hypothetical protein